MERAATCKRETSEIWQETQQLSSLAEPGADGCKKV